MHHLTRRLAFVAAVAVLLGGAALAIIRSGEHASADDSLLTVYITPNGINPQQCQVSRNDMVQWKNETSAVQRLHFDGIEMDSSDIAPGQIWTGLSVTAGGNYRYHVVDHPEWTGNVYQPQFSQTNPRICEKLPPTPTPTATPTRTPITPSPTATLPPPPPRELAPNCFGQRGCAVAPWLAFDGGS